MKGKFTAVLFIILFLLVVAVVFTFLTALDRRNQNVEPEPEINPVVITEITPDPNAVAETPTTVVTAAMAMTAGTNTPDTLSATLAIGAFVAAASLTMRMICDSVVSSPTRVARARR